ncbi:MAG: hypothetical protein LUH56_02915 [Oscillospiraceae bacterium]|nr:hypothetical protein [Oscillospiraceae bacterium]
MKKLISILLISAISLSIFTACGDTDAFSDVTTDIAGYTYASEDSEEEPEESTEEPESESGIYDDTAVVEAYKTGDTSALSSDDLLILQAASDAIAVFYTDGMSDYEIILAAHDYITTHVTYDLDELNLIGSAKSDSSTPFGALIYGEAICMGYTTTFQLMMDMLGVESIIVSGSSDGEDHAWNMVCLDDKWYHIDCTWDDFVPDYEGRRAFHTYFMVTDGVMAIDHVWDMDSTPTADSEDCVYYFTQNLYAETTEELKAIIESEIASGDLRAEAAVPLGEDLGIPSLKNASIYAYWQNDFDTYSVVIYYLE